MHACIQADRQTDTHRQTNRQTDRQTDIQAGRQTVPASERRLRVKQRAVLLGIWQQDYVQNEASGDSFKCSTMCQTEVRCNAGRALKANIWGLSFNHNQSGIWRCYTDNSKLQNWRKYQARPWHVLISSHLPWPKQSWRSSQGWLAAQDPLISAES